MARGHGPTHGGVCPRCRARSLRDSRFCNQCGNRLGAQYTEAFGSTPSATAARSAPPRPTPAPAALARVEHRSPSSTASYPLPAPRKRRRIDPSKLVGPLVAAVLCFGVGVASSGIVRQSTPADAPTVAGAERAAERIQERAVPLEPVAPVDAVDVDGALIAGATRRLDLAEAGLLPGDVVTRIDGRPVRDLAEMVATVEAAPAGEPLRVEYLRDGRRQRTVIVPGDAGSAMESGPPE